MKHRLTIAAIAATAALGGTCAFLVPAASASPSAAKKHTLTFTSVTESTVNFSRTTLAQQDKDVNKAGKTTGYDLLYIIFNPKTETAKLTVTVIASGGFVYAVASGNASSAVRGTLTGGTGTFKGAAGTIVAKDLNKAGTKTAVTITYHT
jgi:hypothetical protein